MGALEGIVGKARANGVHDLRHLSSAEARAMEPQLNCEGALLSPSTGIIDSHSYMAALRADAEDAGASIALESPVIGGNVLPGGRDLVISTGGPDAMDLTCRHVINSAGLCAPALARCILGSFLRRSQEGETGTDNIKLEFGTEDDSAKAVGIPFPHFAKGNYYSLQQAGPAPFSTLVYPCPNQAGLGVHATIDLGGAMRFGPDVEWLDGPGSGATSWNSDLDYSVDPRRADSFYAEVRKYWPGLQDGALVPDYSGVRPKICGPGEKAADFEIWAGKDHGVPALVNLFGIESPGLTSSLALAEAAVDALDTKA
jgi:L-2-hydroxyglutarate oxidase LhgO